MRGPGLGRVLSFVIQTVSVHWRPVGDRRAAVEHDEADGDLGAVDGLRRHDDARRDQVGERLRVDEDLLRREVVPFCRVLVDGRSVVRDDEEEPRPAEALGDDRRSWSTTSTRRWGRARNRSRACRSGCRRSRSCCRATGRSGPSSAASSVATEPRLTTLKATAAVAPAVTRARRGDGLDLQVGPREQGDDEECVVVGRVVRSLGAALEEHEPRVGGDGDLPAALDLAGQLDTLGARVVEPAAQARGVRERAEDDRLRRGVARLPQGDRVRPGAPPAAAVPSFCTVHVMSMLSPSNAVARVAMSVTTRSGAGAWLT